MPRYASLFACPATLSNKESSLAVSPNSAPAARTTNARNAAADTFIFILRGILAAPYFALALRAFLLR